MPAKSRTSQVARTKVLGVDKAPNRSAQDASSNSAQQRRACQAPDLRRAAREDVDLISVIASILFMCSVFASRTACSSCSSTSTSPTQKPHKSNFMVRSQCWRTRTQIHANGQDPQTRGGTLRSMRCNLRGSSDSGMGTSRTAL